MKDKITNVPKPPKNLKGEAKLKYIFDQFNKQPGVKKMMKELANK